MIPQETDPDLPVSVQESLAEAWVSGGLLSDWGPECSSAYKDLLKEVAIIFITPTIVWSQVKHRGGGRHSPIHQ